MERPNSGRVHPHRRKNRAPPHLVRTGRSPATTMGGERHRLRAPTTEAVQPGTRPRRQCFPSCPDTGRLHGEDSPTLPGTPEHTRTDGATGRQPGEAGARTSHCHAHRMRAAGNRASDAGDEQGGTTTGEPVVPVVAVCELDALVETVHILPAHLVCSLTRGQGTEMAAHRSPTLATDIPVRFCDPADPWQPLATPGSRTQQPPTQNARLGNPSRAPAQPARSLINRPRVATPPESTRCAGARARTVVQRIARLMPCGSPRRHARRTPELPRSTPA